MADDARPCEVGLSVVPAGGSAMPTSDPDGSLVVFPGGRSHPLGLVDWAGCPSVLPGMLANGGCAATLGLARYDDK